MLPPKVASLRLANFRQSPQCLRGGSTCPPKRPISGAHLLAGRRPHTRCIQSLLLRSCDPDEAQNAYAVQTPPFQSVTTSAPQSLAQFNGRRRLASQATTVFCSSNHSCLAALAWFPADCAQG